MDKAQFRNLTQNIEALENMSFVLNSSYQLSCTAYFGDSELAKEVGNAVNSIIKPIIDDYKLHEREKLVEFLEKEHA